MLNARSGFSVIFRFVHFFGRICSECTGGVSSRAALGESGTENLYVEISLLGSYSATKTAPLSEGTTVTFSEIPVGTKIRAKGQIYSVLEESEKEILYTGESEEITVKDGENTLVLKMKRATPEGTGITALPTTAGKYYLTQDITISSTWTVPSGETVLDLNGYGILMTGRYSVISVGSEASLTINDSGNTVHYVTLSEYHATAVSDSGEETAPSNGTGVVKISGGYIAGGAASQGGGINLSGSLTFNGGTLIGNNGTAHGGAIFARGNLTITGGKIIYNTASYQGAGIDFGDKALVITGGTISNNYSKGNSVSHAGGIHLCAGNGTCTISGNPVIKDNSNSTGTVNVGMDANQYITIGSVGLGESASIGVSMATVGVFTNSTNTSYNDESKFVSDDESYIVSRSSGGQLELTSKLATALKAGAEIVCAYSETKWGDTNQVSCSFKYENGAYTNTTTSGYTAATLTFDETENTLTVVFTEDIYIDTTIFYISSSQYKYNRVRDESSSSATSGSTMSFSSITINGEDITSTLTQSS